ncbi:MAG TPA: lytic transglycosylase domain-containing protein [Candidatus Limnocylindrales bacterium]|nr:lytic transglycosylase domain-containing protein [Candidatus Limnocylindrales bacterium]
MINCFSLHKYGSGLCILFFLILISTEAWGEIYQYIDKNGVLTFTDTPPRNVPYKVKIYSKSSSQVRSNKKKTTPRIFISQSALGKNQGSNLILPKDPFKPLVLTSVSEKSMIQLSKPPSTGPIRSDESRSIPSPYKEHIEEMAQKYKINPDLVKAIIKVESNYNPKAVSPKGAQGLMQLMPETAKRFGVNDPFDPHENIAGGIKYLRFLWDLFGGDLKLVLAGYNAGEQRVVQYGNNVPPITETQNYVQKVLSLSGLSSTFARFSEPIYRFVDKNGVLTFTNIPRLKN